MKSVNPYNLAVVLFTALGSYTYGFNSSIIASVTGLPSFNEYFNLTTEGPRASWSTQMIGAMNSLYFAGGLIGCLSIGWLADFIGRKRSIQFICALCIIASIITTSSINIGMFLAGRAIQGFAAGMIDTICPLYQSEISPAHARGEMVGMHAVFLVAGYSGSSWVGFGTYFERDFRIQWRLCMAFQILAPLLLLLGSQWIPESPRYLVYNTRNEEGLAVLKKLHSTKDDPQGELADAEFIQIQRQVEIDRAYELPWIELWKKPNTRKRLIYGFLAIAIAQSSGVLVINNYQIVLYKGLGISGWKALLLLSVYTTWAAFMNYINAILLDRIGRVKLMVAGMIGAALAVSCEAAMVARFAGSDNDVGNGFGVLFMFVFITFFAGGMDASCYVYLSEIFPTWMRAQGVSFSVAGLFSTSLIYTGCASDAFAAIGWKYFLVFIIVPLCGTAFIWYLFPETNGLCLEEIGVLFGDDIAESASDAVENAGTKRFQVTEGIENDEGNNYDIRSDDGSRGEKM